MLEKSPLGLYTANLGNLKPNEEAVIDIEYAQLLRFEKGRIRITVPTVIGSRYGDEEKDGHIAPHQSVEVNALVEYPFTARLDILGDIASGSVTCPSHSADISAIDSGKRTPRNKKHETCSHCFLTTSLRVHGAWSKHKRRELCCKD
jgi:Ca-activated chloride channel family protein